MRVLLTLALLFTGSLGYAQPVGVDGKPIQTKEPPKVAVDPDPSAVLVGPTEIVAPGSYVRVKITGTIGDDPKLTVVPAVKNMDLVTFSDGSYGITAQLTESGAYTFFLGVNKGGKTAITTLTLTVKQPDPPPIPDANVTKLQEAFQQDGSPQDLKAKLVSLYRQMAKEKAATWKDLAVLLETTSKGMFSDTDLPATRQAATEILTEKLGSKNGPVNVNIQQTVFNALADAIANVNVK